MFGHVFRPNDSLEPSKRLFWLAGVISRLRPGEKQAKGGPGLTVLPGLCSSREEIHNATEPSSLGLRQTDMVDSMVILYS
jgi:hypothetical protein